MDGAPQVKSKRLMLNQNYNLVGGFTSMVGCNIDEVGKAKIGKDKLTNKEKFTF